MSSNSERYIRTVCGDIPADKFGHIQCHEHIWLRKGPSYYVNSALLLDDHEKSLIELCDYRSAGGTAIVDAQPGGFGRDAFMLSGLSEKSGVSIVAVTGFHRFSFMESNCMHMSLSEDELAELYRSEVSEGMITDGVRSDIKAGIIKTAYEAGAFEKEETLRFFRAAALAARDTGAPIMVHTEKDTDIMKLVGFFGEMGVPAEELMLCHLDRTAPDPELHKALAGKGCTLCYDSIHRYKYVSDEQELGLILTMCQEGFDDRIVLSLDTTSQRLRAYGAPDMGLDFILTSFIPILKKSGISEEQIEKMCRKNAVLFLAARS